MRISLAQINPIVGDIAGNLDKMISTIEECHLYDPDLVVFPELCVTGYPPRDLLERDWFIDRAERAVEELTKVSKDYPKMGIIIGAPQRTGRTSGRGLYNSALLLDKGEVVHVQHKTLLPNYDVFDEVRYFDVARSIEP
ncbi:MAG: NAD+ synthase, partial [Thermoplasmata archaeon]|nr:NAD+ synthase [Thermoplasmata archaeon]